MKRFLLLLPALFLLVAGNGQTIDRIEYFFDADPGFGLAIPVSFVPGSSVFATFSINTSGLSYGVHALMVRAKNVNGRWSTVSATTICVPDPGPGIPVTALEYYIDTDPGFGNALQVPVTSGNNVPAYFEVNTTGLAKGMHILCVRAKDGQKRWSVLNTALLYLEDADPDTPLRKLEYFVDTDPGFGKAIPLSINAGTRVSSLFTVNTAAMLPGMHFVNLRAEDDKNRWSVLMTYPYVYLPDLTSPVITGMEYFIDNDPGYGSAIPVAVSQGSRVSPSFVPDVSQLARGMHILCVRVRNADGMWSILQSYLFYHSTEEKSPVARLEYYIDNDPGYGNGTSVPVVPAHSLVAEFSADMTGVSQGTHRFVIRAKDDAGRWSIVQSTSFENNSITRTWTGAVSDDWNAAGNWTPEGVPGMEDDVLIPASAPRMPVVRDNGLGCRKLEVTSGADVLINEGIILTVNGLLILKGGQN